MINKKHPFVFLDISIDKDPPERLLFKLFFDYAPYPSQNFRALCTGEKKPLHYKGSYFHRIVKGSMAQGGDFLNHDDESTGLLSVKLADRDSHDSSFSITFGARHNLVRNNVAFGELVQGHDLLNKIENAGNEEGTPTVPVKIVNCGEIYLHENLELYEASQTRIEKQKKAYNIQVPTRSNSGTNLQELDPYSQINWVQESTRFNTSKHTSELSVNQTFGLCSNSVSSSVASLISPLKLRAFEDQKILEYSGRNRIAPGTDSSVCCNCIKSQCLKRYCECFANGNYCDKACTCQDCRNLKEYELEVEGARDHVELRNPQAFGLDESGVRVPSSTAINTVCNCRKSSCSKKYCDCYKALTGCTDRCGCETCKNMYGTKQDYEVACKQNLQMPLTGIDSQQYNFMHPPNLTSPTSPFQHQYFGEDASRTKLQFGGFPAQVCSNLYNPNLLPPINLNSNNQTTLPGYSQTTYNTYNFQFHVNHDPRSQVQNQIVLPGENPEFLQDPSAQKKSESNFPTTKKGDSDPFFEESKKYL